MMVQNKHTERTALCHGCQDGFTEFPKTFVWRTRVNICESTFWNRFPYFRRYYYFESIFLNYKWTLKKWGKLWRRRWQNGFCQLSNRNPLRSSFCGLFQKSPSHLSCAYESPEDTVKILEAWGLGWDSVVISSSLLLLSPWNVASQKREG